MYIEKELLLPPKKRKRKGTYAHGNTISVLLTFLSIQVNENRLSTDTFFLHKQTIIDWEASGPGIIAD